MLGREGISKEKIEVIAKRIRKKKVEMIEAPRAINTNASKNEVQKEKAGEPRMELKTQLQFELTEFAGDRGEDRIPASGNYNYWLLLMEYFLAKSDTFEIHCWNEEVASIDELTSKLPGLFEITKESQMTIFMGLLTVEIAEFLLTHHVGKDGTLAWFSVFLSNGEQHIFSSEHWGTEFFVPDVTEEDLVFIKHVAPDETNFNRYT